MKGRSGFEGDDCGVLTGTEEERALFETRETTFGEMTFLRHSASVEGFEPGWELTPTTLGATEATWHGS